ncbi:MAG: glutathione binding-like protein, partial [Microcystaceae cyanobacterium]
MKLYYSPGACSLADHIALHEARLAFEHESVDLKAKTTASGADFTAINPKGYVPALVLDSGETVTENIAVLDWIARQEPALGLDGTLGRTRLLEALAYISTEVHKSFKPMFTGASDHEKAKAREMVTKRLQLLADGIEGDYLFGERPSVADCYLFVMLLWSDKFGIAIPEPLPALRDR